VKSVSVDTNSLSGRGASDITKCVKARAHEYGGPNVWIVNSSADISGLVRKMYVGSSLRTKLIA
jgi:hypothetical protein